MGFAPIINFFIKRKLNPNHLTTLGFLISIVAAFLFAKSKLQLAGFLMLVAGAFDFVDGKVARATNRVTKFGALYDSTLDRYSEVFISFGLLYHYIKQTMLNWESGNPDLSIITAVAVSVGLGGAIMTSYVRARAEGLGMQCKVGFMQRPERVVFIAAGAVFTYFHELTLVVAIIVVAVFSNLTAIQRVYDVWISEKDNADQFISVKNKSEPEL
jgi:CDP-diacylglycerol--glycerol-3-phosphate 3-phosphatidyltransferase